LCAFCSGNNIRLFNDAAYAILVHSKDAATLTEAAIEFPDLSWAEAFSASKVIANGTGWRIGAICGSPDFVGDIATIKGNTDSGFFAPAAVGVMAALKNDRASIEQHRKIYEDRINLLVKLLEQNNMKLTVFPKAGFFTLWHAPRKAFNEKIRDAEHFNDLMILKTGIVGVPFGRYIRYAVTSPVELWQYKIHDAFQCADISY
jgi:LL-diaminopimelate aminotransferase